MFYGHIFYILYFINNYFASTPIPLITKKTTNATTMKSIVLANNFPYKTHFHERFSNLSIFNFFKIGAKIRGVIKSSMKDLVHSPTLVAIKSQIATQITL
jgi:hypothetical protein